MRRMAVLALVAAGAIGLWQLAPTSSVSAGPPVDEKIVAVSGAPASFADVIEAVADWTRAEFLDRGAES